MNWWGFVLLLFQTLTVFGHGIEDFANTFNPEVVNDGNRVVAQIERELGVKFSLRVYLEPSLVPESSRIPSNSLDVLIIRRPFTLQIASGSEMARWGWNRERDAARLERVIRENFRMGWFDPGLYDVLRYVKNRLSKGPERFSPQYQWSPFSIFFSGLIGFAIVYLLFNFSSLRLMFLQKLNPHEKI